MVLLAKSQVSLIGGAMSNRFSYHASLYQNNYSKEENQKFTAAFGELTQRFAEAMKTGLTPTDEKVQGLVKEHFEFCLQFWKPTREAYKSLAMSYILPSPYRDSYEEVAQGLGKFHYEAIIEWADKNLGD
jgi:hypothetical protein